MYASILIKKIISSFCLSSGIFNFKIKKNAEKGLYCILMYHRVTFPERTVQAGMYVKPETFSNHLKFLKKHFEAISLKDMQLLNNERNPGNLDKPKCVLTFDDGWKDFYSNAFPRLVEYQIPATVFLPTEFIGKNKRFWTDDFAYLLSNKGETDFNRLTGTGVRTILEKIDGLNGAFDSKLEAGIEYLKKLSLSEIEKVLRGLSEIWQVVNIKSADFLSWSEITEMMKSGLVSFGSHTATHQILTTLNEEEIKKELIESQKMLLEKKIVDDSCIAFCYPNGNYTKEIAEMVRSSGYHLAVTTRKGWNNFDGDRFALLRIGIHEDMTSTTSLFACRLAEII